MTLLLAASFCLALSRATTLPACVKPDVETFGNDSVSPLLPQGNTAPVIKGIDYTDWVLAGTDPVLTPASPPNAIGVGPLSSLLGGEIVLYPRGSIAAVEPVRSFTLRSVQHGCFLNGATQGGLTATSCKIRATGYTLSDKKVSGTFDYTADALVGASMMEKKFNNFKALKNVTFEVVGASLGLVPLTVLALDDVAICRHY